MEEQKPNIEQILKMMAENLGEEPRPMVLMSRYFLSGYPNRHRSGSLSSICLTSPPSTSISS